MTDVDIWLSVTIASNTTTTILPLLSVAVYHTNLQILSFCFEFDLFINEMLFCFMQER